MLEFIIQQWLSLIITALFGLIVYRIRKTFKQDLEAKRKEELYIREALAALLRIEMFQIYEDCDKKECVSKDDVEVFYSLYKPYTGLGYNGVVDRLEKSFSEHKFTVCKTEE